MVDSLTVSMAASELTWEDVDKRVKQTGFKTRSSYIQYLIEKDIHRKKLDNVRFIEIIILIELSVVVLLLTVL